MSEEQDRPEPIASALDDRPQPMRQGLARLLDNLYGLHFRPGHLDAVMDVINLHAPVKVAVSSPVEPTMEQQTDRLAEIQAALASREDKGSTHWPGCETSPRHRDCAIAYLVAEVQSLRAERDRLNKELLAWEDREAAVCPEDVGFEEVIKALEAELDTIKADNKRLGADFTQCSAVLESVVAALYGQPVSEFEESFPPVRHAMDVRAELDTLREALAKVCRGAISTEYIVRDRQGAKRLGHNPSWVKVHDVKLALSPQTAEETQK